MEWPHAFTPTCCLSVCTHNVHERMRQSESCPPAMHLGWQASYRPAARPLKYKSHRSAVRLSGAIKEVLLRCCRAALKRHDAGGAQNGARAECLLPRPGMQLAALQGLAIAGLLVQQRRLLLLLLLVVHMRLVPLPLQRAVGWGWGWASRAGLAAQRGQRLACGKLQVVQALPLVLVHAPQALQDGRKGGPLLRVFLPAVIDELPIRPWHLFPIHRRLLP